jgi:hypothetical protein
MNAAIEQRMEQFVQEILGLVEHASAERRSAVLSAVTALLGDAGGPSTTNASSARSSRGSAPANVSRKAAAPPRGGQGRRRGASATTRDAVTPAGVAPSPPSDAPTMAADRARPVSGTEEGMGEVADGAAPVSTATPANGAARPVPDREARVLDAVGTLVRPTAGEVAGQTGLPNGSVAVALRALLARGLVTQRRTGRGMEYALPGTAALA